MTAAASAAADVRKDVEEVMKVIEDFGTLLQKETAALKKADFREVEFLQAQKRAFAKAYHGLISGLSARKEEVVRLDVPTREKLICARTCFTIILNDNLRALEAAKEGTRRLVTRILDVARRSIAEEQQTNYSQKGKMQAYKSSTLSLSVDRKL